MRVSIQFTSIIKPFNIFNSNILLICIFFFCHLDFIDIVKVELQKPAENGEIPGTLNPQKEDIRPKERDIRQKKGNIQRN